MDAAKLVLLVGLALLVWTGYQAMTYREALRLTQQEFSGLPPPLFMQLLAAVTACVLGGLQTSGGFAPIRVSDAPKPVVMRPQRTDFVTFNHRGTLLGCLPHMKALNEQGKSSSRLQIS